MKIIHVCPYYTPAICGVKQVVEELSSRQVKAGHSVSVFTSDWDKYQRVTPLHENINGVDVHRFRHWFKVANFVTFWPQVFFKLMLTDFDVVHSHTFGHPHVVLAATAAFLKRKPHIHTTHCTWTDAYRSLAGRIGVWVSYNIFSKFVMRFMTKKIIAITPWEIPYILKFGGRQHQIEVIPNGVSEIFFQPEVSKTYFQDKYGIKDKVILFLGRISVTKGPDKLVEAAKIVLSQREDVHFVLIGPDEGLKSKVIELIDNHPKILLLDAIRNRPELISAMVSAYIFALPSYREGLPLTLMEAMAAGLPVVASPVNGVPFEITDGQNGFLVEYGDISTMVEKFNLFLDNQDLRDQISNFNREYAHKYEWDIIAKQTTKLYV